LTEADAREDVEKIIREAERISDILKDLSHYVKKREPHKQTINLNELVERTVEARTRELSLRNIQIFKELTPIPLLQADREQIRGVLLNLIKNSEQAISEFHGFGEIRIRTYAKGDNIEIVVSDDGPGVAEENLPKILDPLFTTKTNRMGLGLSISNQIIKAHGGEMKVESEWGKGAAFIIRLPVIDGVSEKQKEKKEQVPRSLKGLRCLVVDDEPTMLDLVSRYLIKEGCEVETAQSVKDALKMAEKGEFDVAICDMKMPEEGGEVFYRVIGENKPAFRRRIIFITGDLLDAHIKLFIESTKNRYILKPFQLEALKEIILELMKGQEEPED
jgi:CheY-like chemotaxis protein